MQEHSPKLLLGPHAPRFEDAGDQIFILEKGQMHALCRFLWTGKLQAQIDKDKADIKEGQSGIDAGDVQFTCFGDDYSRCD